MYSYYLTETTLAINFFKLFFLVDGTFREYVNSVCFKDCSSAWRRKSRMFRRASQICLRFILMWIMVLPLDLGHVHTNMFSFENAYFSLRFGLPSTLRWHFCQGKRRFLKTPFSHCSVDCENGGLWKRCMLSHVMHILPVDIYVYRYI